MLQMIINLSKTDSVAKKHKINQKFSITAKILITLSNKAEYFSEGIQI
jgi:hypothetical protein